MNGNSVVPMEVLRLGTTNQMRILKYDQSKSRPMEERSFKSYWVASVILATVTVSVFGAYVALAFQSNPAVSQPIPISVSSLDKTASVSSSVSGLELSLSLNSVQLQRGQSIGATVTVFNSLGTVNNVSAASEWPIKGLTTGACGTLNEPLGLALFQGYYASQNISSAVAALELYYPGVYNCPAILDVKYYLFQPQTYSATIGVTPSFGPQTPYPITVSVGVNGSWTGSAVNQSAAHHLFSPGIYTVVAGDEWGDILMLHFVVGLP